MGTNRPRHTDRCNPYKKLVRTASGLVVSRLGLLSVASSAWLPPTNTHNCKGVHSDFILNSCGCGLGESSMRLASCKVFVLPRKSDCDDFAANCRLCVSEFVTFVLSVSWIRGSDGGELT